MSFNEKTIRPSTLEDYKGQEQIKKGLSLYIKAAKIRQTTLDHTIIFGASGLGKTTLANIIANEMGAPFRSVDAPTIKTVEDMVSILQLLVDGEILFIDEIHRLPKKIEEILYFAMEDFEIRVKLKDNDFITEKLPKFTLIGATTTNGMISEPLRNRFNISLELIPYEKNTLTDIIIRSAKILNTQIDEECARSIAQRSRGIPRIANGFLRRASDIALIINNNIIDEEVVKETFELLNIDEIGLTRQDRKYLFTLMKQFNCGPVGIDTLSSAMNDDKKTLEETVEPYLIQIGFLCRTARGRLLTKKGYDHIEKNEVLKF